MCSRLRCVYGRSRLGIGLVLLHVIAHGNVTLLVDDDGGAFLPSRAVVLNPDSSGPLADVISA